MRKHLPIILCLLFLVGCAHSRENVKDAYLGYHKTLLVVQKEVVLAAIDGEFSPPVKETLYAIIDQAVRLDNTTKSILQAYEDGMTTREVVLAHLGELARYVYRIVNLAQTYGVDVKGAPE